MIEQDYKITGWFTIGRPVVDTRCDVNWGSHGCSLLKGHEGTCKCSCCMCPNGQHDPEYLDGEGACCVAEFPYYGPDTRFYGADVESRGLLRHD